MGSTIWTMLMQFHNANVIFKPIQENVVVNGIKGSAKV